MIRDRSEESWWALVASPSKIKEYYSYNQSYIPDLWYHGQPGIDEGVTDPFMAGASWRNPSIRAPSYHCLSLAP
jgi:hypothetical protein